MISMANLSIKSENYKKAREEEISELRRGPWTIEEDTLLIRYIAVHGEGQWNILAKQAGIFLNPSIFPLILLMFYPFFFFKHLLF